MKSRTFFAIPVLLASFFSAPAVAVWQEPQGSMENAGVNIVDSWINNGSQTSRITSTESRGKGQMPHERLCEGFGTGYCNFASSSYNAEASLIMPACKVSSDTFCIESLAVVTSTGEAQMKNFSNAGGPKIDADSAKGLPAGGTISLWSSKELTNYFAIHSVLLMNFNRSTGRFTPNDMELSLVPYKLRTGNYVSPTNSENYNSAEKRWQTGASSAAGCVWTAKGECGEEIDFPEGNYSYQVTLRVAKSIGTWFKGRIQNPQIQVDAIDRSTNRITFTGNPMETLKAYVKIPKSEVTRDQIDWLCGDQCPAWFASTVNIRADYPNAPGGLEVFREAAGDAAAAVETKWSFGLVPPFSNPCLKDASRVNGLVSTNASVYQAGAPSFDGKTLNYKVGSYHYLPDGVTEAQGVYNLLINSATARCLYGFSNAPVSATVQVVNSSGEQQVITSVLAENKGWINLAVAGFSYSSDRIKVSFQQEGGASVSVPLATTLPASRGTSTSLSAAQRSQIKSVLSKAKGNTKFICTGIYSNAKDKTTAIKRARAACDYAKSLDKNFSFWSQAKPTKAASYNGKVLIVSK